MKQTLLGRSFNFRIFATVMLVSLLPILICDVVMLPLVVSGSENSRTQSAQSQMEQITAAFSAITACMSAQCEAAADNAELFTAGQKEDIYRFLYTACSECAQQGMSCAVFSQQGAMNCAVNDTDAFSALSPDWGVLRAAFSTDDTVFLSDKKTLYAAKRFALDKENSAYGCFVMALSQAGLDAAVAGLYDAAGSVYLINQKWHTLYQSAFGQNGDMVQTLREEFLNGQPLTGGTNEYRFYVRRDEASGFYVLLGQPVLFTNGVMNTIYVIFAALGILSVLLCLWGAWVLSRHLSKPVRELSEAMRQVEKGHFDVRIDTKRQDELGKLSGSFNHMVEEYQAYLQRSVLRQKELNNTQLRMMQAQLNPHFLYNTLDSMKWLGVTHQVPQVATLSSDLAAILRAGISGDEFVTLEKELELIDKYIDIQSIRFEDRFCCEIAVAEEFQSCIVPKLVLQPIVENAIIHGVADMDDGYIKIWAEKVLDTLILYVSDNGCGMDKEMIDKLNSGEAGEANGHLGLYNVNSIIRLHFGNNYGISAYSKKGGGSCVSVRIPYRKGSGQDA